MPHIARASILLLLGLSTFTNVIAAPAPQMQNSDQQPASTDANVDTTVAATQGQGQGQEQNINAASVDNQNMVEGQSDNVANLAQEDEGVFQLTKAPEIVDDEEETKVDVTNTDGEDQTVNNAEQQPNAAADTTGEPQEQTMQNPAATSPDQEEEAISPDSNQEYDEEGNMYILSRKQRPNETSAQRDARKKKSAEDRAKEIQRRIDAYMGGNGAEEEEEKTGPRNFEDMVVENTEDVQNTENIQDPDYLLAKMLQEEEDANFRTAQALANSEGVSQADIMNKFSGIGGIQRPKKPTTVNPLKIQRQSAELSLDYLRKLAEEGSTYEEGTRPNDLTARPYMPTNILGSQVNPEYIASRGGGGATGSRGARTNYGSGPSIFNPQEPKVWDVNPNPKGKGAAVEKGMKKSSQYDNLFLSFVRDQKRRAQQDRMNEINLNSNSPAYGGNTANSSPGNSESVQPQQIGSEQVGQAEESSSNIGPATTLEDASTGSPENDPYTFSPEEEKKIPPPPGLTKAQPPKEARVINSQDRQFMEQVRDKNIDWLVNKILDVGLSPFDEDGEMLPMNELRGLAIQALKSELLG